MMVPDVKWEQFEFAADAWQWLDDNGFRQSGNGFRQSLPDDHLTFEHRDGRMAMLCLPEGESADEPTEIKIFRSLYA